MNAPADLASLACPHTPQGMRREEWLLRLELAACYRLFDWLGWSESIYNHITVRLPALPGQPERFLINPYGLHYTEVTAGNLVTIDVEGNKVCDSPWPVNPAGFVIHSAIHRARPDAHCVMHTHTTAGMAVACKHDGFRYDNFYAANLHGLVAHHDFEGVTTNEDEQPRLVASLGDGEVLVLRNHGLLTLGPHVPGAFARMWSTQRACEVQVMTDSMAGPNRAIPQSVLAGMPRQLQAMTQAAGNARRGELPFQALLRKAGISYQMLA